MLLNKQVFCQNNTLDVVNVSKNVFNSLYTVIKYCISVPKNECICKDIFKYTKVFKYVHTYKILFHMITSVWTLIVFVFCDLVLTSGSIRKYYCVVSRITLIRLPHYYMQRIRNLREADQSRASRANVANNKKLVIKYLLKNAYINTCFDVCFPFNLYARLDNQTDRVRTSATGHATCHVPHAKPHAFGLVSQQQEGVNFSDQYNVQC